MWAKIKDWLLQLLLGTKLVSKEKINDIHDKIIKNFDDIDEDKDGKISIKEIIDYIKK